MRSFDTIEGLRQSLIEFQRLDNRTWIVERHGDRTPARGRADQLGLAQAA